MLTDLFRLQLDMLGARAELAAGVLSKWLLDRNTPPGSGDQPVITMPGFMASDATLSRLNAYLNRNGFDAHGWGLGRNLGPQGRSWSEHLDLIGQSVGDKVKELNDTHGTRVALVGHSLGGVYARELAGRMEQEIDRVLMLGSPTFHPYLVRHHNRVVSTFGYWLSRQSQVELAGRSGILHWGAGQPAMPCVAIHSPVDGVVDEDSCIIPQYIINQSSKKAPRENIRVLTSHIGMGVNPWVLLTIADRLVEERDGWKSFNPYRYFPESLRWAVSALFPRPAVGRDSNSTIAMAEAG
jgi:pimeloyl-ACP methyl ester carboxylesterase